MLLYSVQLFRNDVNLTITWPRAIQRKINIPHTSQVQVINAILLGVYYTLVRVRFAFSY